MRQFDVFVFDENFDESQGKLPQPPFTDKELAWFYTNEWNKHLDDIDGEWVVFAHPSIRIDRDFLNNVAEVTDSFPMVDAFAPRIRTDKGNFLGGFLLRPAAKGSGFVEIDENAPLRYVAARHPYLGIYSRRIIQRTGGFDTTLPANARLADYTLRMMHAGGKMFSVPYLVAQAESSLANSEMPHLPSGTEQESQQGTAEDLPHGTAGESSAKGSATKSTACDDAPDLSSTAIILSKSFGIEASLMFALRHPSVIPTLLRNRKERKEKRKAATLLSKLKADFLKEVVRD